MKKHILRICIALILIVGASLLIYFLVRDNSQFYVDNFIKTELKKNDSVYVKMNNLNGRISDDAYAKNLQFFDSYKESLDYFCKLLSNKKLEKNSKEKITNQMTNFNKKYQAFSSSLNALENYLNKENRNETELKKLQEKTDADFVNLNISFYSLNKEVEILIKNLVFAGTYYDATLTINSLKNILISNCINNNYGNFSLVNEVVKKTTELKTNNYCVNDNAIKLAIKYNNVYKNAENLFKDYFENEILDEKGDLQDILNLLKSEGYYEKN